MEEIKIIGGKKPIVYTPPKVELEKDLDWSKRAKKIKMKNLTEEETNGEGN